MRRLKEIKRKCAQFDRRGRVTLNIRSIYFGLICSFDLRLLSIFTGPPYWHARSDEELVETQDFFCPISFFSAIFKHVLLFQYTRGQVAIWCDVRSNPGVPNVSIQSFLCFLAPIKIFLEPSQQHMEVMLQGQRLKFGNLVKA